MSTVTIEELERRIFLLEEQYIRLKSEHDDLLARHVALEFRYNEFVGYFSDWNLTLDTLRVNKISFGGYNSDHSERVVAYLSGADFLLKTDSETSVTILSANNITATAANDASVFAVGGCMSVNAGKSISVSAADVIDVSASNIVTSASRDSIHKAGVLHRTESPTLDIHTTEKLRLDTFGVGFTFFPTSMHYWCPWDGSGSPPQPPEHPYTASGFGFNLDENGDYPAHVFQPNYRPIE